MLVWWRILILVVASYCMGNISFARTMASSRHMDITTKGSGNPGTMNVVRTMGWKFGLFTLLLDVAKAVIPCVLGCLFLEYPNMSSLPGVYIAGLSTIVGHMFPVFHRFKGGKSVASAIGVFLAADWRFALGAIAIALLIFLLFRYGSVASLCCIFMMTVVEYLKFFVFDFEPSDALLLAAPATKDQILLAILLGVMTALIFFAHRENLKRLFEGRERRMEDLQFDKTADSGTESGARSDNDSPDK
ncbi:glycerol-3-phosphate acyltransferase [Clostridia bacterium]|nr:glycerol-3-phosphate acyltransferase [Clostridia bacterium]